MAGDVAGSVHRVQPALADGVREGSRRARSVSWPEDPGGGRGDDRPLGARRARAAGQHPRCDHHDAGGQQPDCDVPEPQTRPASPLASEIPGRRPSRAEQITGARSSRPGGTRLPGDPVMPTTGHAEESARCD